ncbi:MAG: biotin synthase BioB, partial [Nitrospirae bacterium]
HTFKDRIETIESAISLGLSVCSGGIFGIGESWEDRIDMAFTLKNLSVDSIPINFLTPIKGTPLGDMETLKPLDALKIISIYRLIMPDREIRVCGGRPNTLKQLNTMVFFAGADSMMIGNYLTTTGRAVEEDMELISDLGLTIKSAENELKYSP